VKGTGRKVQGEWQCRLVKKKQETIGQETKLGFFVSTKTHTQWSMQT
jgi:hypothetical protein